MLQINTTFKSFAINLTLGLVAMLAFTSCQTSAINSNTATNSSNVTTSNSNASNIANTNSTTTAADTANFPVTMPVVDAMFSEENFREAAKTAAQLSDEEIDKIRDAARNSVIQMSGDLSEDDARSTKTSAGDAQREIEKLVGQQKAAKFMDFVRSRWAGDSDGLLTAKPNSIPNDTRIVVNSPAYRMDIFKDGKLVKSYKVGIGYPEFPLPTGLRQAKEIIFNPTWTPPDEPWVKGKVQPGKKIEAGSKLNPLGPIKIPIGLPSLIHGGKDPSRLGTFASHGCVGLTRPTVQDFALELASMSGTPLTAEEIKSHAKEKDQTKELKLSQPVPVELRYETIVVEDGKVHIFRDVYERGTNTAENVKRVLEAFDVNFDQLSEAEKTQLRDALDKMAVDAHGKEVTNDGNNNSADPKAKTVTRTIKGQKEIVVNVAALRGKGYPAPVSLVQK
jgi:lipoprotein-anchoring transpeptidase ErfK/SrfK